MYLTRESLKNHLLNTRLIEAGNTILIAFSGGKDSTALLHLLNALKDELDFKIKAVYFNHQLRDDSGEEESWVNSFCRRFELDLISSGKDVKAYSVKHKKNLEDAASNLRYRFFSSVLEKYPQAKLATAHTQSDQTETFFIKLLRGSGTEGLSGIFSRKNNTVIRPLLPFDQEAVLTYLKSNKLEYYHDSSNLDKSFLRNHIRLDLIPGIKRISPKIDHHIEHTSVILEDEFYFFQKLAKQYLEEKLILNTVLPLDSFLGIDIALQRHILREYIRKIKGNLFNLNFDHLSSLIHHIYQSKNITLPNLDLIIKKGYLFPKTFTVPEINQKITFEECPVTLKLESLAKSLIINLCDSYVQPADNQSVILSGEGLIFPLILRSPQREDKYAKINSDLHQSVFEMIREQGAPEEFRNLYPVLTDGTGQLIWCYSSPISDQFKVTGDAKSNFLKISLV